MTLTSPAVAIVWENWRLTRGEAAGRLALGIVGGSTILALSDSGATLAFSLLLSQHAMFWMSIAKLNGGRFADGYRPGFPLRLLYTRPVPTGVLVGIAMAYDAVSGAALYLVSAAFLGYAFGHPLPLLSVVVWIVTFHLVSTSVQWSTRNRVVQWLGAVGVSLPFFGLLMYRAEWSPPHVEFSLADNVLMAAIGLAAFGVAVAGVARQRRGDTPVASARIPATTGFPEWLVTLFRFSCPTSSATRAQVWFDLKSSGLPVLTIGLALAIVIPLLFVVTTQLDLMLSGLFTRPATRVVAAAMMVFSLPAVLILGGNAFGIRARQGRTYASAFDVTQSCGTARMAGLKVLVRSACLLAALLVVGTSVWTSASVIPFDVLEDNDTIIEKSRSPFGGWMRAIRGSVGAMSASELFALAFVAVIVVAVMVAARAALQALRARYPRRVNIAGSLLLLYGLALVLRAPDGQGGNGLDVLVMEALFGATPWIAATASVLATVYLVWRVLEERLLTLGQACGAILVSTTFAVAWATVLGAAGVSLAGLSATDAVGMLLPALLPLTASVLAPWSLSRVRHT